MESRSLDSFIDETIRISSVHGYHPTTFIGMRQRYGTVTAISRLVASGEVQSGFRRLIELGLKDYTIEQAVILFSNEFSKSVFEAAKWRLSQAANASTKQS
ncbi:hypothetical protein SAMN05192571_111101 [Pleomorphomonas diazotrophica]|uniref:hypothetical protein n=1 Tax=Pleomorphomonas diazotrophica TaxID=1166257 RepID=UPI0008F3F56B|nr:hypothetical protein [Pleomorphomonas diazotrophica]SFN00077.1 hypothetical protein SAMN05192571_111101 [Pleomorphomonas diazotrophica]